MCVHNIKVEANFSKRTKLHPPIFNSILIPCIIVYSLGKVLTISVVRNVRILLVYEHQTQIYLMLGDFVFGVANISLTILVI